MKRWWLLLPALVLLLAGCDYQSYLGSRVAPGETITESRDVSGFSKVQVAGGGTATIVQGEEESLTVTTGENLMGTVKSEVVGNELRLSRETDEGIAPFGGEVEYAVSLIDVSGLEVEGSGEIVSEGLVAENLELKIEGSGDMELGLAIETLTAEIGGSGKYQLTGTVSAQTISIDGSGNYKARELESKDAAVEINGSGKAEVNVSDNLDVSISGSGTVRYLGDPTMGEVDLSGSGKIERIEE